MTRNLHISLKQLAAAALISIGATGAAHAQKAEVIHW
ncbi:MAG: hypothetical protein RJA44_1408, partial [Pseudomonadota bacterium]